MGSGSGGGDNDSLVDGAIVVDPVRVGEAVHPASARRQREQYHENNVAEWAAHLHVQGLPAASRHFHAKLSGLKRINVDDATPQADTHRWTPNIILHAIGRRCKVCAVGWMSVPKLE